MTKNVLNWVTPNCKCPTCAPNGKSLVRIDNLIGRRIEGPDAEGFWTVTEYSHSSKEGYKETVTKTKQL